MADLHVVLLEMAGEAAIEEVVLNRAVDGEASRRGITPTAGDLVQERTFLTQSMSPNPDRAERLLQRIQRTDGLGPERFAALLRRTALLRAMVEGDVNLSPELVRSVWDAAHGPKRTSQVIATDQLSLAHDAHERLRNGEAFGDVARAMSRDASASDGGRLPAVSRLDPAWPSAFRAALFETAPGSVSVTLAIENRFLLIKVLEDIPETGHSFEEGRDAAARAARRTQERILMDRLARSLVSSPSLTILDPAASWRK